ncbi:hypothetical protein [Streptomyces sp. 5-10]|uniref:hypothetical protein n=1 Tax=Streptomyces sp. 5-10 TaxID=878925 RepID=UPI00168ABB8F|nr:hypothetical protein [Streptomyces sp. 5-10]MBD3004523.1 hypothetical protein [Streptomyces sp. 5-10]
MEPSMLPEFVHDLATWTRQSAATLWCAKAAQGSPFWWPPGVANPGKAALELREEVYGRMLGQVGEHHLAHGMALEAQQKATIRSYRELADWHADTLEASYRMPHKIGKDITYLAARTQMGMYRLELDKLPASRGFILWDTPIGEAEPRGQLTAHYEPGTGRLLDVELVDDMMKGFRESDTPVVAASWRVLPGAKEVGVVFYSDGTKARANYEAFAESQRRELPPGMSLDKDAMKLQLSDPLPLEREQVLPLDRTLGWFDDDSVEERLRPTISSDPSFLREAERRHVGDQFVQANEKVLPMLTQMVKTFVSTLVIRHMKLTAREEVPAPKHSVKRMRRAGADVESQRPAVEVVRIGKPLRHRSNKAKGSGSSWKVKTVVGPVIRTRQYIPARNEYRDGIWEIEPYVAGDPDAPWSERAKVFLLE